MASIDFSLVKASFEAAVQSYAQTAHVQQYMAQHLAQKVAQLPLEKIFLVRRCRILEIGCGPGNFTLSLLHHLQQRAANAVVLDGVISAASVDMSAWEVELICNDLSQAMLQHTYAQLQPWLSPQKVVKRDIPQGVEAETNAICGAELDAANGTVLQSDYRASLASGPRLVVSQVHLIQGNVLDAMVQARLEQLGPFDLVVSNAVFQWFPQLSLALAQIRSYVHSQGYLAFSSFAQGTLAEFKFLQGATHGLQYLSASEVEQAFFEAKWQLLSYEQENVQHHFSSAREVLRHLQHTGVNAFGQERLSVGQMRALLRRYEEHFHSDQGVGLSWCFYIALGQQRHS